MGKNRVPKEVSLAVTKGRTPRSKPSQSVRDRLLDAAEELFAEHGFNGAPMRDITARAGTRLADVNDHFGSKEFLFQEVIARRASQINSDRKEKLAEIPTLKSKSAEVRLIVEAFAAPLLQRSLENQGWRNYLRLLSQLTNTRSLILVSIAEHFNPIGETFIERLNQVYPKIQRRSAVNAYLLMVSSTMAVFADNKRIDIMTNHVEQSAQFQANYDDMVTFVAGGIIAISRGV